MPTRIDDLTAAQDRQDDKSAAKLDAKGLSVDTTSYGRVTLTGTSSSSAEHDEAVDAAWSAPGVAEVDDHIQVAY